jgi:SHS2 domain-containing protein
MCSKKGYKFLDHTADEYVLAYGTSLNEAFESAALAMFSIMTDISTITPKDGKFIQVRAEDEISLLYSWLEILLLEFDIERKLYSQFNVSKIQKTDEGTSLKAMIFGEPFDPKKHPSRTEIKAVTYHRMELIKKKKKIIVKFILDI